MENLNLGARKFGILSYTATLISDLGVLKLDQTRIRSVFTNGCIIHWNIHKQKLFYFNCFYNIIQIKVISFSSAVDHFADRCVMGVKIGDIYIQCLGSVRV